MCGWYEQNFFVVIFYIPSGAIENKRMFAVPVSLNCNSQHDWIMLTAWLNNAGSLGWFVSMMFGKHKQAVSLFQSWWWCDIPPALCGWRYWHTSWYTTALGGGSWTWFPSFLLPSLRYGTALGSWHMYFGLLMINIAVFFTMLWTSVWLYCMFQDCNLTACSYFSVQHILYKNLHHSHCTWMYHILMPVSIFNREL
jgi:hypothetical protein